MAAENAPMVDRSELVLAVIDVQEKLAAAMDRRAETVSAASRLVRVATLLGAPVVVTRQNPSGLGGDVAELAAPLEAAEAAGLLAEVEKMAFCACEEPAFLAALDGTGRRQVVLTGMETHICVLQTALALLGRGLRVFVAADACCSRRKVDHRIALDRMRQAGVVVATSESVIYEALGCAGTDEFRAALSIVKGA